MHSTTLALHRGGDRDFLIHLSGLTHEERLADHRAGLFSRHQRTLWASLYPNEVPLVNDEFEWIALGLP